MEKKTKKKFWGTLGRYLLTFMFISSWAVLGVALALSVANVNVGGNISFTAKDVRATIAKVGKGVTGGTLADADNKLQTIEFTSKDVTGDDVKKSASWQNLDITFDQDEISREVSDVALTFTITSNDDEKAVNVKIGDLITETGTTNVDYSLSVKDQTGVAVSDKATIVLANQNDFVTVELTFSVKDPNKSAKVVNFSLGVELKASNADDSGSTGSETPKPIEGLTNLSFTNYNDTASTVTVNAASTDLSGEVVIPSKIIKGGKEYTVTSIGETTLTSTTSLSTKARTQSAIAKTQDTTISGFKGTSITSVVIPDTIITVGDNAFDTCESLSSITMGKNVKIIGAEAFARCGRLTSISLPESLTTVGMFAFGGCSFSSIFIPRNVNSIGEGAFYCANIDTMESTLKNISVGTGNTVFSNEGNALIEKGTKTLIQGCDNTIIPNWVEVIGNGAFNGCAGLSNITIPSTVTQIGVFAFAGCSSLNSVTFENKTGWSTGGSAISSNDLANTTKAADLLTNTHAEHTWTRGSSGETPVPPPVEDNPLIYTIINGTTNVSVKAKDKNSISGDIDIPSEVEIDGANYTVTTIDVEAFYDSNITSVVIPDTITTIGDFAFGTCLKLSSVTLGKNVKVIGEQAFWSCLKLSNISLPESLTSIGQGAFLYCPFSSIFIPKNVNSIGENAFSCINEAVESTLETITVDANNTAYLVEGNALIEISTKTLLRGCDNTIIPSWIERIQDHAFEGCKKLKEIVLPSTLKYIGAFAFGSCTSLESVVFKNTTGWCTGMEGKIAISADELATPDRALQLLKYTWNANAWIRS